MIRRDDGEGGSQIFSRLLSIPSLLPFPPRRYEGKMLKFERFMDSKERKLVYFMDCSSSIRR